MPITKTAEEKTQKKIIAVEKRFGGNAATRKNQKPKINLSRIIQSFKMINYALWEVIENGATLPKTTTVKGVVTEMPITTAEEKTQRRLEVKARSTLMMGIPNEHHLIFISIKDAKKLLEAVEKRFGRNAATRKTQRNLLKNKTDLDTITIDDLYNNIKMYEPEVKGMSSSSSSTQNMAFMSSSNNNTSNTNEAVNIAHGIAIASTQVNAANSTNINNLRDAVICAFFASQPNSLQLVHEDLQQIHLDDMEEIDLRWKMTMLTKEDKGLLKNTVRKLAVNGNETIGFDKSKVECYNYHKRRHFARKCRALRNQDNKNKCPEANNCKKGLGYESYNAVPPLYTGNFMPPTPDLSFTCLDEFVNEPVVENCKAMSSEEEPKVVRKYNDAPSIEEWVSNDEEEDVSQPKTKRKTIGLNLVLRAILMKSGLVSINTARQNISKAAVLVNSNRQVNAAHSKTTVNAARPMSYLSKTTNSTV
ncbi:hypothetical protein Tco_0711765 [Tanacetum coccineum]